MCNNVTFTRSQLEKIKPKTNLKLQGRLSECLTFFVTHTKRHKSRDDCRLCVAPTDEGDSTYDEPIRWEWKKKKCSIAIAVKSSAAVERIRNVLFRRYWFKAKVGSAQIDLLQICILYGPLVKNRIDVSVSFSTVACYFFPFMVDKLFRYFCATLKAGWWSGEQYMVNDDEVKSTNRNTLLQYLACVCLRASGPSRVDSHFFPSRTSLGSTHSVRNQKT